MSAKKKAPASGEAGGEIDVSAMYRVTVNRVVPKLYGARFTPRGSYVVKGRVAQELGDAIRSIEKV